ncbi:M20/M25/M40 family metallo-hydrolase [Georgenia sp. AZ-5]|uniref:M20/M25/M40 family metallo-hydrolase n=1 Tax=Georgenia sp. AZ-5 TaxID=3367526 RepID=UPI0037546BC6
MDAVELLRDLVRVRSVNPPGDEAEVADRLGAYLSGAGLGTETLVSPTGRVNLVARLPGPRDRPALVLLSHSDVVPVREEAWSHDPFGAEVADGVLWGRGTLDMKGIAVMHAVAAAEQARSGRTPEREIVVAMTADEEDGGGEGARWLIDSHAERVGLGEGRPPPEVLGEGAYGIAGTLERPVIPIAAGEKTAVWLEIVAEGGSGHGGLPPSRQAVVSLAGALEAVAGFGTPRVHPVIREQFGTLAGVTSGGFAAVLRALASRFGGAVARAVAPQLRRRSSLGMLLADSLTPTMVSAGYKANVVPAQARALLDCRLLPDTDVRAFVRAVDRRAHRRGARVATAVQKGHGPVSGKGPLYETLVRASAELAPRAVPTISLTPAITDLRFFRARGATAYGWCPLVLDQDLLGTIHGDDERVPLEDFRRAVAVMTDVVRQATSG